MRPLGGRLGIPDAAAPAADDGSILGRRLLLGTSREEGMPASVMRRGFREVLGVFILATLLVTERTSKLSSVRLANTVVLL